MKLPGLGHSGFLRDRPPPRTGWLAETCLGLQLVRGRWPTTCIQLSGVFMRLAVLAFLLGALPPSSRLPTPVALTGAWDARFELDSAWHLPAQPRTHAITGRIDFSQGTATDSLHPQPVYAGHSQIDFKPLGFRLGSSEAIGWYTASDTIKVILDPTVDHGHVELVGLQQDQRIDGTWTMIGDPAGARGRFVLTRRGTR